MEPRSLSAAFHSVSLSSFSVVAVAGSTTCSSLSEVVIVLFLLVRGRSYSLVPIGRGLRARFGDGDCTGTYRHDEVVLKFIEFMQLF